ncbi:MAG: CPXCG motif-containing cysteine-rich protein [Candidatus Omnitrophica bacterium]|nr:CPXCG motif-containing cysteine-rich protein [Candidatus Omnitrophota bacterium]MDE2008703.1 CPXCG motif-containing cysteine-rich protein [Candidatus Omnitrophota bacterium]MDE2214844.1 CPXCG motif-containing cysteine-rich protein [Candidatus Omnitrophota bacterium]MDE2231964.1 CPXCG motif-containing cysteine-rich protein [Candidatus Omnitrophota bacterium]
MSLEEFVHFLCPYCSQTNQLPVDITAGNSQEIVVDCEVCCAPVVLNIRLRGNEILTVEARKENE